LKVSDSTTQQVPIYNVFEAYLCYNRYFRQYIRERFNFDYAFDVDVSISSRDNCVFNFDIKTREFFLSGDLDSVNHIIDNLGVIGKDIEIIKDEKDEKETNELDNWIAHIDDAEHVFCIHECFNSHGTRTVVGKVLRHINGEELALNKTPTETIHYWDIVKKWYEHSIPLNPGDEYVYSLKPVYTYFTLKRGDDKGKAVVYQAKEFKKDAMYFVPEEFKDDSKNCPIDKLIKIDTDNEDDNLEFVLKKTQYGDKLFTKTKYVEDFHIEAPDKIFPCEVADVCIEKYNETGSLTNEKVA